MSMIVAPKNTADSEIYSTNTTSLVMDGSSLDRMMKLAAIMASGKATIPAHLQKNEADCLAVVMQSMQWRMNPFAVAQKTHLVNGVLGYEAQLVNAVIQASGITQDRFHYEFFGPWENIIGRFNVIDVPAKDGKKAYQFRVPAYDMRDEDGLGVRVWATLKGESEPRILELLLTQASVRNSPLWASDPKQQLAYLAVKRWTRLYAPDVILGVYTQDELDAEIRDITPPTQPLPSTPSEMAAASRPAIAHSPERDQIIKDLEEVALAQNMETLQKAWSLLDKEHRTTVGRDEWARIKSMAMPLEQEPQA